MDGVGRQTIAAEWRVKVKAIAAIPGPRKNEVLVLASVTEGDRDLEVPADRINVEFVFVKQSDVAEG